MRTIQTASQKRERNTDVEQSLEKQLAILQERFTALEHKFLHLQEKDVTVTENAAGKDTDVSVDSVCGDHHPNITSSALEVKTYTYLMQAAANGTTDESTVSSSYYPYISNGSI